MGQAAAGPARLDSKWSLTQQSAPLSFPWLSSVCSEHSLPFEPPREAGPSFSPPGTQTSLSQPPLRL